MEKSYGRPSSYKPEYDDMLVKHMSEGLSFESFAGVVRSCKQTLYNWLEMYPSFLDAKKEGTELCRLWWERIGAKLASGEIEKGNSTIWIFNMKNRFRDDWTDRQQHEHTGTAINLNVTMPDAD